MLLFSLKIPERQNFPGQLLHQSNLPVKGIDFFLFSGQLHNLILNVQKGLCHSILIHLIPNLVLKGFLNDFFN